VTLGEALRDAAARLAAAGVPEAGVDAEWLLAHALECSRAELAVERARELTDGERRSVDELVARRAAREPLAYVLGEWGFRRLTLRTDRRALVPRPETEIVVERCLALLDGRDEPRVLDLGVGSGAIALAIADEHRGAHVLGIDRSHDALGLARENASRAGLAARVTFEHGDFTVPPHGAFDLVVSNPPYVDEHELDALEPEVRDWEPREALVGPGAVEAVARTALRVLEPGGWLVVETHAERASVAAGLLDSIGFDTVRITRDLSGRERVVEGQARA
jgi:release factor glutamine methyltransferase